MDIYCPRCGEPWDNDSFHAEAMESGRTYQEVTRDFQVRGCEAMEYCFDGRHNEHADTFRAEASSALMDIMGDDMDGVASMLDDAEYLGMFD